MASSSSSNNGEGEKKECIRIELKQVNNPKSLDCFQCGFTWMYHRPRDIVMFNYGSDVYCYLCGPLEEAKDAAVLEAKKIGEHMSQSDLGLKYKSLNDETNWLKVRRNLPGFKCIICKTIEGEPGELDMAIFGNELNVYRLDENTILCNYCKQLVYVDKKIKILLYRKYNGRDPPDDGKYPLANFNFF